MNSSFTLRGLLSRYSLVGVFVVVAVIFSILKPGTYPTSHTAQSIASTNAVLAMVALAAMVPLAAGQFDVSVAAQLSFAQSLMAGLVIKQGWSPLAAMVVVILVGLVVGAVNGVLVGYAKLNSFIVTLASGVLVHGLAQWYTNGESIFGTMPRWFLRLGRGSVVGVPLPLVYVLAAAAVLVIAYEYTTWGRRSTATGANPRAAEIVGLPIRRLTLNAFVVAGALAAIGGVISVSLLGSASPNVGGSYLFPAFAAAFLGATSIRPGRFNPIGTVLALYMLQAGITGLRQLGAQSYVEDFFNGAALVTAVALSTWTARRRSVVRREPAPTQPVEAPHEAKESVDVLGS